MSNKPKISLELNSTEINLIINALASRLAWQPNSREITLKIIDYLRESLVGNYDDNRQLTK